MPFTVSDVPHLPAGFTETFTSDTVKANGLALHAVVVGDGPPLLPLPAWPQFRYGSATVAECPSPWAYPWSTPVPAWGDATVGKPVAPCPP